MSKQNNLLKMNCQLSYKKVGTYDNFAITLSDGTYVAIKFIKYNGKLFYKLRKYIEECK